MNIWVEYWKSEDMRNHVKGSHAQMKEQTKWSPPDPSKINRRFFNTQDEATKFAKRMGDDGFHALVKKDGIGA